MIATLRAGMSLAALPDAVLFDLDGTLADTAPDLAYALNRTLEHFRHRATAL